jgi:hypothetical protein
MLNILNSEDFLFFIFFKYFQNFFFYQSLSKILPNEITIAKKKQNGTVSIYLILLSVTKNVCHKKFFTFIPISSGFFWKKKKIYYFTKKLKIFFFKGKPKILKISFIFKNFSNLKVFFNVFIKKKF